MKAMTNPERCKACELCVKNCPRGAIELTGHLNAGGYKTVKVEPVRCVGCGICYTICPDGVFTIIEE